MLRRARDARRYVLLTAALGGLTAALVVAQAMLLARALAPVVEGTAAWGDVAGVIGWLALVVAARALAVGLQERWAHRAANRTIADLRGQVLRHAVALGPRRDGEGPALATLVTRGLDALEPYFVRYLPQLVLAATVTPATLAVVLGLDWIAAATIAFTLPLVPVFMWLVGVATQTYAQRRLVVLQRLGDQVLDLLAGLPTLRAFGRERGPAERVRALGEAHARATMSTLRVAFLSGMVLELLTTLSVALVAVGVGFRLVHGDLDLLTGLTVLVLAPEVFAPVRQVGTHFHASSDGVAAAEQAFDLLERPTPPSGTLAAPDLRTTSVALSGVGVVAPGRGALAPAGLDLDVRPGSVVALAGPNGVGKTTAALVVLGLLTPDQGRVVLQPAGAPPVDLADVDRTSWWAQTAWVPQRPTLLPGSLAAAVAADREVAPDARARAARLTGLDEVVAAREDGWSHVLGHGGAGLSLGERQRVALTRALLGDEQLVVLDEPSAHLDHDGAAVVHRVVDELRRQGRTVLLVAHRRELLATADVVVTVGASATEPAREEGRDD
nr:thiol reductant ABC exporter subunit CydD [Cellulomonas sp. APG4]